VTQRRSELLPFRASLRGRVRALGVSFLAVVALLAIACSSSSSATPNPEDSPTTEATTAATSEAATATSAATASTGAAESTTPAASSTTVDVDNVLAHVVALAGDIGPRPAGTAAERDAADYIAAVLEDAGYETAIEPFPIATRVDASAVSVTGSDVAVRPRMFSGSATAEATGALVYGALGAPADLAGIDVAGKILLLDRGVIPFGEKVRTAELAGALGVIIANNQPGAFSGALGTRPATVPVVAISEAEGALLRPLAAAGVEATLRAAIDDIRGESQNVVGRSGAVCRFYIGGHYDSVPQGPGANDNASGTALMLEIARVQRTDGLCVIAFGSEEIGLFGSEAFVATQSLADGAFMLNFDQAGRLGGPIVIGDAALTDVLLAALEGLPLRAGQFPPFASSDHVSFLNRGIPAVTITSGDDPRVHTAGDDVANVSRDDLAVMLEAGARALEAAITASG